MKNPINLKTLLVLLLAAPFSANAATIVSVNFTEFATDTQQINSDATNGFETFGIASQGSVVGGWNNQNAGGTFNNLTDQLSASTTVDMTTNRPNGAASFNVVYEDTPLRGGVDDYTATATALTVALSQLNATFTQGYKIIAYFGGFTGNFGASISDGTTTYFFKPDQTIPATAAFAQTTDTVDDGTGTAPVAQYAVFGTDLAPLTADSVTLTLDTLYGGGSALGGFQIVGVPEPSTALLGAIGALVLLRRRR